MTDYLPGTVLLALYQEGAFVHPRPDGLGEGPEEGRTGEGTEPRTKPTPLVAFGRLVRVAFVGLVARLIVGRATA